MTTKRFYKNKDSAEQSQEWFNQRLREGQILYRGKTFSRGCIGKKLARKEKSA